MPETMRETQNLNPEHDAGDEECGTCGNPKWQRACAVCSKEMAALEYKKSVAEQAKKAGEKSGSKRLRHRTEIPKDPKTGKPKYGPGSDTWEESKRNLGIK